MDFAKLERSFQEGEKPKLVFKDGTNVFSHNPPFKLYKYILKQEPNPKAFTEPDGSNPLFYVDSKKKFDYLVDFGFDAMAVDNEGFSLGDVLHVSLFENLDKETLRAIVKNTKDREFLDFYRSYGGSLVLTPEEEEEEDEEVDVGEHHGGSGGESPHGALTLHKIPEKLTLHKKLVGHDPDTPNFSELSEEFPDHHWSFFTDANDKFKFFTTREGYGMLEDLARTLEPVFKDLRDAPGFSEREGFEIYTQKENLKTGATWSDEEYANPSFLYQYCLNKAVQRFPETIVMMDTAAQLGVLDTFKDKPELTVVSLGGGCSYELLAVKAIFNRFSPRTKLRLVSMDYEPFWGNIVKPLGIEFEQIDFNKPSEELRKQLERYSPDFYVMSYVYRTYIREQHKAFIQMLCKTSFGIFINDRNTEYLTFGAMDYKLSSNGLLTLVSSAFSGYPYVKALNERDGVFPKPIYKDTPWYKPRDFTKGKPLAKKVSRR